MNISTAKFKMLGLFAGLTVAALSQPALLAQEPAATMPMSPPTFAGDASQPNSQMAAVLNELASLDPKPIDSLDAKDARKQPTVAMAAAKILAKRNMELKEPVGNVDDKKIKADGVPDEIPIRIYAPKGNGAFPVLVYYHGGGFVIATIDTYDASCRALANTAKCIVVAVEYRKAPENKYPAAVDDSFAAYQWVTQHAAEFGGDPKNGAVAGESAGGNLATVVSMLAIEKGAQLPVFELLVYPVVDNDMTTPSYIKNAAAKPLNMAMMGWFFKQYLSDASSASDPHVCPMKVADVSKLPPTMVITASIDPLMSEGQAYADKLKKAGVQVEYKNYEGVTHEFFGLGAIVDTAKQAESDASKALMKAFANAK